jgi:hypothetical protein
VQPQPPSPVAESAEEGISPTPSFSLENGYDLVRIIMNIIFHILFWEVI